MSGTAQALGGSDPIEVSPARFVSQSLMPFGQTSRILGLCHERGGLSSVYYSTS